MIVLFTANGKDRNEIEALEPRGDRGEASVFKAFKMCVKGFRDQAIFNGRAFLSDLKITITVSAFEIVMQIGHQLLLRRLIETDFLRQQ